MTKGFAVAGVGGGGGGRRARHGRVSCDGDGVESGRRRRVAAPPAAAAAGGTTMLLVLVVSFVLCSSIVFLTTQLPTTIVVSAQEEEDVDNPNLASLYDVSLYENTDHLDHEIRIVKSMEQFETEILQSSQLWLLVLDNIQTNPKAKELAASMFLLGTLVKGLFPIAVIDTATEFGSELASTYKVSKAPGVVLLGSDNKFKAYKKETSLKKITDLQHMAQVLMSTAGETLTERSKRLNLQGKAGGAGGGGSGNNDTGPSAVVQLTSDNFDAVVYDNPLVVMVAFTAPWCGHCQRLLPEWEQAAKGVKGQGAIMGWVDATVEQSLAQQYGVKGFPTIKIFPGGTPKKPTDAKDYAGERTAASMVREVLAEVDRTGVPPDIPELTSQQVLEEHCAGHNHICVFGVLPHIADSGADGRNKYKSIIQQVSKSFRATAAFSFLWFEGTAQPKLEQALELSFGYPALVAVSVDRKAYAVMRTSFTEKSITKFLHGVTTGKQPTIPLSDIPTVVTVTPWDGQDAAPVEDEFSLDEIMGDDWDSDEKKGEENNDEL